MNNNAQFADFSFNSIQAHGTQNTAKAINHINLRNPHHAAWGAFQAGMRFLQQYAGRSPDNSETIAKSNLQLLHRSLLKDPSYTQSLKDARKRISGSNLPNSCCIFNDTDLRADLLSLNTGTTIQLKAPQDSCAMYLSITGKPSIQSPDLSLPSDKHWWQRYLREDHGESLKNGEAVIISSRGRIKRLLTAEKKECILLRIQLPNNRN